MLDSVSGFVKIHVEEYWNHYIVRVNAAGKMVKMQDWKLVGKN